MKICSLNEGKSRDNFPSLIVIFEFLSEFWIFELLSEFWIFEPFKRLTDLELEIETV